MRYFQYCLVQPSVGIVNKKYLIYTGQWKSNTQASPCFLQRKTLIEIFNNEIFKRETCENYSN